MRAHVRRFLHGLGATADPPRALALFTAAAAVGLADAHYNAGVMALRGLNVPAAGAAGGAGGGAPAAEAGTVRGEWSGVECDAWG